MDLVLPLTAVDVLVGAGSRPVRADLVRQHSSGATVLVTGGHESSDGAIHPAGLRDVTFQMPANRDLFTIVLSPS